MNIKTAIYWTTFWVFLAAAFGAGIWLFKGTQSALEYTAGYILEWSLSMDNIFVFLMIFSSFGIERQLQRRILNYGIFGAMAMRMVFIFLGVALVERLEWILYIFGALLVITSIKMIFEKERKEIDPRKNLFVKFFKKIFPATNELHGERFFVRKNGIIYATPLFLALIVVESSDIMFAIDSIPAIFAVTRDPLIIYSSNIFAIAGLRSLYFVLEHLSVLFIFLQKGVGAILLFTGVKMLLLILDIHIPIPISLGVIVGILLISILASIYVSRKIKYILEKK